MKSTLMLAICIAPLFSYGKARDVLCNESVSSRIQVTPRRITVIDFPITPKQVIPGEPSFDFKQMGSDLLVKPLSSRSKTNLLVYMDDRRCLFDLVTHPYRGDDLLIVKDPKDSKFEVNFER